MRKLLVVSLLSLISIINISLVSQLAYAQGAPVLNTNKNNYVSPSPEPKAAQSAQAETTVSPKPTSSLEAPVLNSSNNTDQPASVTASNTTGVSAASNTPPPAPEVLPTDQGIITADYTVTSAVVVTVASSTLSTSATSTTATTTASQVIQLKGHAEPNIYITLYIYSTPIIVSVKTDAEGNWSYNVDKELENGQHTVYVAKVNNSGTVVARSNPIFFTKTEAAVALNSSDSVPVNQANVNFFQQYFWWVMALLLVLIVIIAITIIGYSAQRNDDNGPQNPTGPSGTPTPGPTLS